MSHNLPQTVTDFYKDVLGLAKHKHKTQLWNFLVL